ncbi:MAG: mechanosensitive ion channel family protein [Actinomycetota bacterium]|nr:mechanosensitive ion channel family protein [Actinomycetota bacterium]
MPTLAVLTAHAETVSTACGPPEEAGAVCQGVYRLTSNETVAQASELFLARPTKIALIVVLAWLAGRFVRRAIRRFTKGLGSVSADVVTVADRSAGTLLRTGGGTHRTAQRAETIGALLSSVAGSAVWSVAGLMVLSELGIDLGPLVAGAGIAGIAIGFGAQNLVRDFFSGIFMLIEDQYGVGDVIDAGPATGTVEGVSLRTTRLRDVEGNVWHIPNGVIDRVANKSQEWSRALLDIQVSYQTDTDRAAAVIATVADEMSNDPAWSSEILAKPEVWGVESLAADGVTIRLVVKTKPLAQWRVSRELRARIKQAFDAEGIEIPFPQRTVWHRGDGAFDHARSAAAGASHD